jgi:hypothetical protein
MATKPGANFFGFAPLNDKQLSELSALEKDLNAVILAVKPSTPFANLTPEQVSRLQQFERQQGIVALACQK